MPDPTNTQIADRLTLFAALLELKDTSPFAVRAYTRAADGIRSSPASVAELVRSGRVRELRGIGSSIESKLRELVETGEIAELRTLEKELSPALVAYGRTLGLTPARTMEAQSLLPALQGEYWKGRDYVFAEHGRDNILTDTDFMTMVRSKDWKLVHFLDEPFGQLFHLASDPNEIQNLWNDAASQPQKERMLAALREWRIRSQYHTRDWPKDWR